METKIVKKNGHQWAEIRLATGGCNIQVFVSKGGWMYKDSEYVGEANKPKSRYYSKDTSEYNIRWSQNGAAFLKFDELEEIFKEIESAKALLD